MPSLFEALLGANNPVTQWTDRNSNMLTGLGASLLSDGMNFTPMQQGAAMDREAAQKRDADAKLATSVKAGSAALRRYGFIDLADAVDSNSLPMSDAWNEAFRRKNAKTGGEAFTLAPGQVRYAADGSVIASGGEVPPDPKEAFNMEKDLTSQYLGTDPLKNYQVVRNGYEKVRSSSTQDSGPGDISMIFAYMKMLDPTSVVREGEFATAENAGGVGQQISNLYNRLLNGERLTPELRKQFLSSADQIYQGAVGNLNDINEQFKRRADAWSVNSNNFLITPETYANDPLGLR